MAGIHRERPGCRCHRCRRRASRPSTWATASGCRRGCPTATCCATDDGRIVVNTGMGFEGPLHRRAFDAVDQARPGRSC